MAKLLQPHAQVFAYETIDSSYCYFHRLVIARVALLLSDALQWCLAPNLARLANRHLRKKGPLV